MGTKTNRRAPPGVSRKQAPQVALPQVLWDLLLHLEGSLEEAPDAKRVVLRDLRAQLQLAFPDQFSVNATDLAWQNEPDTEVSE